MACDAELATVPDGGDISALIAEEEHKVRELLTDFKLTTGCKLTDDEPEDRDTIVWHSGNGGWIMDETGRDWNYAVRA
jgi:hypothetical protein